MQQIVIEGLYNKLKDQGENIWRITKVSGNLQITISTEVSSDSSGEDSGTDDTSGEDSGTNDTSTENTNDQEAADAAIAKINALTSSSTEAEVKEARTAFDNLTDTQKKLVSQEVINKLTSAEARIAKSQSDLLTSNGSASDSTGAIIGMSYTVAGQKYLVTGTNTVTFIKAKNVKSVTVPAAVTIKGNTYKVTRIAAKAFTGSKIRRITIGKNVSKITKNAFAKSKATKLILKTKLLKKTSVKGSLKGSKIKTVQVKAGSKTVNRKFVKAYKKIFTKKIAGKKVSVK